MRLKHKGPKPFIVIFLLNMSHFKMQIKITKSHAIIFWKHLAYFETSFSWPFKSAVWMYVREHSHARLSGTLKNPVVLDFFVNFDFDLHLLWVTCSFRAWHCSSVTPLQSQMTGNQGQSSVSLSQTTLTFQFKAKVAIGNNTMSMLL